LKNRKTYTTEQNKVDMRHDTKYAENEVSFECYEGKMTYFILRAG